MQSQQPVRHSRIPEQQGIGQTLPPVPVGIDNFHAQPLPAGVMPNGSRIQVGRYQVITHNFIAEGGFAHVYLARIEGKQGYVVLKRVAVPDTERLKTVEKEIAFMRRLGEHKNIVRYYESRVDALRTGGFEALILMEYCPGGGVIDLMNRRLQQRLTEPEILQIFGDVCEALAYMHYCNPPVLHRDLKVENILILSQNHFKLCDFGSAALSKGDYVPKTLQEVQKLEDDIQRHTTLQYRAPEMIDIYQKKPINEKADIWALGVLLYKLCYYTTPFEEQGQLAILNAHYTIPNQPMFSDSLIRLIRSMLQEDQTKRPNIYQVVRSVSQMKGVECPIRNIYHEPQISPVPSYQSPESTKSESPPSIFERLPSPPHQVPHITPMRRGRPIRHEKSPSEQLTEADPFIPTANAKHTHTSSFSSGTSDVQDKSSRTSPVVQGAREILGFDSDFQPTLTTPSKSLNGSPRPPPEEKKLSTATEPISVQSTPDIRSDTSISRVHHGPRISGPSPSADSSPLLRHGVSPSMEARLQAIKNGGFSSSPQQPPPKPMLPKKSDSPVQNLKSNGSGSYSRDESLQGGEQMVKEAKTSSDMTEYKWAKLESQTLPPISIPPTASPSTSPKSEPVTQTSPSVPYKPKAPPKPARFRVAQRIKVFENISSPQNQDEDTSLSEFEHKFPSMEELSKHLPSSSSSSPRSST